MEYIKKGQSLISLTCKLSLFVLKDIDFVITPEIGTENPKNALLIEIQILKAVGM